jgi:hypothetical protein
MLIISSKEQIDDICRKSRDLWDRLAAEKAQENPHRILKRPLHQPVLVRRGGGSAPRKESRRVHGKQRRSR